MNRKPNIGEYVEVRFDYPRKSQYDYVGFVTRHRFTDDTITVHIVKGDPEKVGKEKHIDWMSEAVVELPDTQLGEDDLKALIDLSLLWNDRKMFMDTVKQLKEFQNLKRY